MNKLTHLIFVQENTVQNLFLFFSIVFFLGVCGVVFRRTYFLITLLAIEIMYAGVICISVMTTLSLSSGIGQMYGLIFLVVAACESAVGLGILIVLFKYGKTLAFDDYEELKG